MNTFGEHDAELPLGSTAAAPDQIRVAELQLGDFAILGNDVPEKDVKPMQGFSIALHRPTTAQAHRVSAALSEGGLVKAPLNKVAWSSAFGALTYRFGVPWLMLALDR